MVRKDVSSLEENTHKKKKKKKILQLPKYMQVYFIAFQRLDEFLTGVLHLLIRKTCARTLERSMARILILLHLESIHNTWHFYFLQMTVEILYYWIVPIVQVKMIVEESDRQNPNTISLTHTHTNTETWAWDKGLMMGV